MGFSGPGQRYMAAAGPIATQAAATEGNIGMAIARMRAAGISENSKVWSDTMNRLAAMTRTIPAEQRAEEDQRMQLERNRYDISQRPGIEAYRRATTDRLTQETQLGEVDLRKKQRESAATKLYGELLRTNIAPGPNGKLVRNQQAIDQGMTEAGYGEEGQVFNGIIAKRNQEDALLTKTQLDEKHKLFEQTTAYTDDILKAVADNAPPIEIQAAFNRFKNQLDRIPGAIPIFPAEWNDSLVPIIKGFNSTHLSESERLARVQAGTPKDPSPWQWQVDDTGKGSFVRAKPDKTVERAEAPGSYPYPGRLTENQKNLDAWRKELFAFRKDAAKGGWKPATSQAAKRLLDKQIEDRIGAKEKDYNSEDALLPQDQLRTKAIQEVLFENQMSQQEYEELNRNALKPPGSGEGARPGAPTGPAHDPLGLFTK